MSTSFVCGWGQALQYSNQGSTIEGQGPAFLFETVQGGDQLKEYWLKQRSIETNLTTGQILSDYLGWSTLVIRFPAPLPFSPLYETRTEDEYGVYIQRKRWAFPLYYRSEGAENFLEWERVEEYNEIGWDDDGNPILGDRIQSRSVYVIEAENDVFQDDPGRGPAYWLAVAPWGNVSSEWILSGPNVPGNNSSGTQSDPIAPTPSIVCLGGTNECPCCAGLLEEASSINARLTKLIPS